MKRFVMGLLVTLMATTAMMPVVAADIPSHPQHTVDEGAYFPRLVEKESCVEISMMVGAVMERYECVRVPEGEHLSTSLDSTNRLDSLLLRIVIPDDLEGHRYDFELTIDGKTMHRRSGETRGFGLRSFFITMSALPPPPVEKKHSLALLNHCDEDLYVRELVLIPRFVSRLRKPYLKDDFILALLTNNLDDTSQFEFISRIVDAPSVKKAFSIEYYYAVRSPEQLHDIIATVKKRCTEYDLGFVAIPCSWWAGTPVEVKQRRDFQQVCWSNTDTYDEGEELKKLLGDRWDIRYGWTIPNKWSSTPWQTMNHPELNAMRHKRLEIAMSLLSEGLGDELLCIVSENEPAYWAFQGSDEKYPVRRSPLWADFNPYTVADAEEEGVMLDPSDGLDIVERIWLQRNLVTYNQRTIAVINKVFPSPTLYTHALLDYTHFPLEGTGHARPYAEVARVNGARLGVEMIWKTDMDALWRIREWGTWATVNREEFDGFSITYHVATLMANYMMGADMLNSYNWQPMNREGDPLEYFNRFMNAIKSGGRVTLSERKRAGEWFPLEEWSGALGRNDALPWGNQITLELKCNRLGSYLHLWLTDGENGAVVAYRLLEYSDIALGGPTTLDLGDFIHLEQTDRVYLHLAADEGWEYFGSAEGPDYALLLNLPVERRRSRYIIEQPDDITSKSLPLLVEKN